MKGKQMWPPWMSSWILITKSIPTPLEDKAKLESVILHIKSWMCSHVAVSKPLVGVHTHKAGAKTILLGQTFKDPATAQPDDKATAWLATFLPAHMLVKKIK